MKDFQAIKTFISSQPEETARFGRELTATFKRADIVLLRGDLGAGKTTLAKGIASGFGIDPNEVTSPTFVIMQCYQGRWPVYHFDLYRLEDAVALDSVERDEYFYGDGISLVEWPERLGDQLPSEYVDIELRHVTPEQRKITVRRVRRKE